MPAAWNRLPMVRMASGWIIRKIRSPTMAGFREGFFQVQDEAAQLVTLLLDPRPGETVMDACAGMGGKTGHIAQRDEKYGKDSGSGHQPGQA